MKVAIQASVKSFSHYWIKYCSEHNVEYKLVNCLHNDIIRELDDCDVLMWHHFQTDPKAILFAKELLFALEQAGKRVFPNFRTGWHFDDKVGQKYLLEAIGAPLVPTYIFYNKIEALNWVNRTTFPKIFKLRGGAGSANVKLVRTPHLAKRLIRKAFGRGFKRYNSLSNFNDTFYKFRLRKVNLTALIKSILHILLAPEYSRIRGRDRGYIYFQDYIPNNDHDIRVIVINKRAFAIKRLVRRNDFRASGSGHLLYDRSHFSETIIKLSFEIAEKLNVQSVAFDFVLNGKVPMLLEISYAFVPEGYFDCPGYWDCSMNWHSGSFNPYGWMIEDIIGTNGQ